MKASLLKTIRHSKGDDRRGKINHKVLTFVVCLVISVFLWFMNMLSKKYTDTIVLNVQYKNMPTNKKLVPTDYLLNVKINSTGYILASYKLGIKNPSLKLSANWFHRESNDYIYTFDTKAHIDKIADQLDEGVKVVEVDPDTLYLQIQHNKN